MIANVNFRLFLNFNVNSFVLADLNSHLDRHENIGKGNLKNCWKFFMNDSRFDNIPLILETPEGRYPTEMKELYKMDKINIKKESKK